MTVERLTGDQWPDLRDFRLAALADAPDAFWATLADEAAYPESRWREFVADVAWFVIRRNGHVVAGAGGVGGPDRDAELIGMWVAPADRGQGHSAILVAAVCGWARAAGASTLSLWVVEGNARAGDLYARFGFRPTGDRDALPPPRVGVEERLRLAL